MKKKLIVAFLSVLAVAACSMLFFGCAHKHEYKAGTVVAPDCTNQGYTVYSCECGDSYESDFVDVMPHKKIEAAEVAPTCSITGYTAGIYCSECGLVFEGRQLIPTIDHIPVTDERVEPTCTSTGLTAGTHCSMCNGVIEGQNVISKLEHRGISGEILEPTCTEKGLTALRYCADCGEILEERQIIPAKGHSYITFNIIKGETCTDEGEKQYICADCGDIVSETTRPTGHRYSYAENEEQSGVCAVCSSQIKIVPRAGNSVYGYYDFFFDKKGAALQTLYYRIYTICEAFAQSQEDLTASKGLYIIDYASMKELNLTQNEAVSVWKVFMLENPAYYWFNNQTTVNYLGVAITTVEDYAKYSDRQKYQNDIDTMAEECRKMVGADKSELETALIIHDYIIDKIDYAASGASLWTHSIVGISSMGEGVCETYAKAYLYLCNLNGLECILVTGNKVQHAWNLVQIDGKWYGADLTWEDTKSNGVGYAYMFMSAAELAKEHTQDTPATYGTKYLYNLPPVAEEGLQFAERVNIKK